MKEKDSINKIISAITNKKPFVVNFGLTRYLITPNNAFDLKTLKDITSIVDTNLVLCAGFDISTNIFMSGYSSDYDNLPLLFSKSYINIDKLDKLSVELNLLNDFINNKSSNSTDIDIEKIIISEKKYTSKNQIFKLISIFLNKITGFDLFLCSQIIWDTNFDFAQINHSDIHDWIIKKQNVNYINSVKLPSDYGDFNLHTFVEEYTDKYHIALSVEDKLQITKLKKPLDVRIHSKCVTGDVFGSKRCDCGNQLKSALILMEKNKSGLLLYLNQEGRGIGFVEKMKAYLLQEQGLDTVEANVKLNHKPDERNYSVAANILKYFSIDNINLITNNPDKIEQLSDNDISVINRIPSITDYNEHNNEYMKTKVNKMNHILDFKK